MSTTTARIGTATPPPIDREGSSNGTSARKEIFGIVERNESSFWTRIGVAFENRDGSWVLKLDYVPTRPEIKLQLREPREPRDPRDAREYPREGQ